MRAEITGNAELGQLWQKISDYSLDEPGSDLTFTQRLARENGWSLRFARRAVEEYKRFMFLAVAAGHPVTPSEQVDQAWHLHLIYTRSYWDEFCGQVVGRPVHHGPTKGGNDEDSKYHDWYERTKESYRRLFGQEPPEDIWPASSARFGDDLAERRVNTKRNWIIPKPRLPRIAVIWLSIAAVGILVALAPLAAQAWGDEWPNVPIAAADSDPKPQILIGIVVVASVVAVLLVLSGLACRGSSCSGCHRRFALTATGANKQSVSNGANQREMQCKHCGQRTWQDVPQGGGWGGCGGCTSATSSGCGASGCAASGCGAGGCGGGGCGGGGCGS